MLKLYYARGTCALASHIALEEAGAAYEAVRLDFAAGQQRSPEYLKINPKGRVPALITDRGILSENPAILAYVAQTFPKAKLAPLDDPFDFAKMQAFNSYLCATVHVAHAHRTRGVRWADEKPSLADMDKKVPGNMTDCFNLIEKEMFVGPWVMGNEFTVADGYLFTIAGWLESDRVDPKVFPKVFDHRNRMAERPAVKKVVAQQAA